jgi:hypothetical protein
MGKKLVFVKKKDLSHHVAIFNTYEMFVYYTSRGEDALQKLEVGCCNHPYRRKSLWPPLAVITESG